ncbi:MAG TPA: excinuclease ATPase subunit [Polyangia bacterium]|nr:excinuclease ATPase subunit [Polyangia bacterium]
MRRRTVLLMVLALSCFATAADARDDRLRLPLADVLNSPDARAKLDPGVQLYFGRQPYAPPVRRMSITTANKKTNFFNKTDQEGCNWVFLSAVRSLQEYAHKMGGNAVVNIVSIYKNQEFVSETQYECGAGSFVGGVALRGEVVLLK